MMAVAYHGIMDRTGWDKRIRRASELSERESSAHEVLRFYRQILEAQHRIYDDVSAQPAAGVPTNNSLRERLDADYAARWMPVVSSMVRRHGPAKLAAEGERIQASDSAYQRQLLADHLNNAVDADEAGAFFARVVWQPIAEFLAAQYKVVTSGSDLKCPVCGGRPQLAVLRPEGDGGKRHLQCSFCLTEWEFRRVLCPACAEVDYVKLPRYSPEEPAAVRVEACDTCKFYLKSFDMTSDGLLVPEVDEIATSVLDLWAIEQGYRKIRANITGF
jgi:FdhE protein